MKELIYDERRQWAKTLYLYQDKSTKDIALEVDTDQASVRLWAQEGGWDGIKRSLLTSKKAQLDRLYGILEKLNDKMKSDDAGITAKDVDLITKYTASIKNLEAETAISEIVPVSEMFIQWLRRKDLPLAKKVIVLFDAFIKQKVVA